MTSGLLDVHAPRSAGCSDHIYIKIKKDRDGLGREVAKAALSGSAKHFFVFDEDIDIYDERKVLWAIATRSQWDYDLMVVPGERERMLSRSLLGNVDLSGIDLPDTVVTGLTDPSIVSPSATPARPRSTAPCQRHPRPACCCSSPR